MAEEIAPTVTVEESIGGLRIVDEITLRPGRVTAFLERHDAIYRPEVERRGYRLAECTVSPPVDVDSEPVHVRIQWSLESMIEARAASPRWDLRLLRDAGTDATRFWEDVSADVIEHLVHPEHLLASLREALQWAPLLIVSTPERDLARGIVDFGPPGNPCHVREWNLAEFTCLLEHHGLRPGRVGLTRSDDRDHATYTIMAVIRGGEWRPALS